MNKLFSKISINFSFWILTIAIFIGLLLPKIVQNGMFLDGITYATISRNLARGLGDFFSPHYTQSLYPQFHEHPPLIFGIQSLFFHIFNDSIYVERIFSFLTAIISLIGIVSIWNLIFKKSHLKKYSWFTVIIWITTPSVFWSFQNNMLENSVSIFSIFAVYFILRSLILKERFWILLSSLFILFSFLSKGLVGLFPLVSGFIFWIINDNFKLNKNFFYSILILIFPFLFYGILILIIPAFNENISHYFAQQLLPALQNKREITGDNRFEILFKLFLELLIPIILSFFVFLKFKKNYFFDTKLYLLFVLIGFSASIPLIASLKQRSFYLVPSIPFFAIAFSIYLIPFFDNLFEKLNEKFISIFKYFSVSLLFFAIILSVSFVGKYSRDEVLIRDIEKIAKIIPNGTIIGTTKKNKYDWVLVAYFARIGNISFDKKTSTNYFLIRKNKTVKNENLQNFEMVNLNLSEFVLYHKKPIQNFK